MRCARDLVDGRNIRASISSESFKRFHGVEMDTYVNGYHDVDERKAGEYNDHRSR